MTIETETLAQEEFEPLPDESEISLEERAARLEIRPWGYFIAGMSVTLLAVALGAVLGYLARPALDPATPVAASISIPADEPVPVKAPAAASSNIDGEAVSPAKPQADSPTAAAESAADTSPTPTIMDFVLSDARHFQGSNDAPVTLVEFSDFACPYCGRFSTETLPRIREQYINTGQVRFTYKHFAILGPMSIRAAEASECAAEQGKFWEYHDQVFGNQASVRGSSGDGALTGLAETIGLDTGAFAECLESGRYADQIQRESQAVAALGVRGTPGFLVNGIFISGAQPFEVFQQVIEEQLQAGSE